MPLAPEKQECPSIVTMFLSIEDLTISSQMSMATDDNNDDSGSETELSTRNRSY